MSEKIEIPKTSAGDYAHSLAKVGLGLIPMVGSTAAELFDKVITPPVNKRRDKCIQQIAETIEELKIKIEDLSNNPKFISAVMQVLEALKNAMFNSALPSSPDDSTVQMYLHYIDILTVWHIRILDLFDNPVIWAKEKNVKLLFSTHNNFDVLFSAYPELKQRKDFCNQIWNDLHNYGLVGNPSLGGIVSLTNQKKTTKFGGEFLGFISRNKGV